MATKKPKGSACFVGGTLIQLEDCEIAIEDLQEGDMVLTVSGEYEPVKWVGHFSKTIDASDPDASIKSYPVRIAKDAFAQNQPKRDLYVSREHSLWVDDVLVPAMDLVNDLTITIQERPEVTYYHVELPTHNVIYAEGLPAESYLDDNNKSIFITDTGPASNVTMIDPEMPQLTSKEIWETKGFAKVVRKGQDSIADQIFERLLQRAKLLSSATASVKQRKVA
jgi:hypothetical protein